MNSFTIMFICTLYYSPIRNLAILADFVCITTSNSHHSRDGGSVRDNGTEGITHTMFARIARFRICEYSPIHLAAQFDDGSRCTWCTHIPLVSIIYDIITDIASSDMKMMNANNCLYYIHTINYCFSHGLPLDLPH